MTVVEERRINLNVVGDDFVSFSAQHLALSPDGEFVLVSTDNGRLIMLERTGAALVWCGAGRGRAGRQAGYEVMTMRAARAAVAARWREGARAKLYAVAYLNPLAPTATSRASPHSTGWTQMRNFFGLPVEQVGYPPLPPPLACARLAYPPCAGSGVHARQGEGGRAPTRGT